MINEYVQLVLLLPAPSLLVLLTAANQDLETQRSHPSMPLRVLVESVSRALLITAGFDKKKFSQDDIIFEVAAVYFNTKMMIFVFLGKLRKYRKKYRKHHVDFLLEDPDLDILAFCQPSFATPPEADKAKEDCIRRRGHQEILHAVGMRRRLLVRIAVIERSLESLEKLAPVVERKLDEWINLWLVYVRHLVEEDSDGPELKTHWRWNEDFKTALNKFRWDPLAERSQLLEVALAARLERLKRRVERRGADGELKEAKGAVKVKVEEQETLGQIGDRVGEQTLHRGEEGHKEATRGQVSKSEELKEEFTEKALDEQINEDQVKTKEVADGNIMKEQSVVEQATEKPVKAEHHTEEQNMEVPVEREKATNGHVIEEQGTEDQRGGKQIKETVTREPCTQEHAVEERVTETEITEIKVTKETVTRGKTTQVKVKEMKIITSTMTRE